MSDFDELENEKKERALKKRLNERFRNFCREAEKFASEVDSAELMFDIPYTELKFVGCHAKSSVNMYPTAHCLVSLVEHPAFVMDIDDIEIVHFERVTLSIKNFDIVFVYKDFTTYKRINSIPMESLETIKNWLDSVDIVFSEGPMPLNWVAVLQ
jgi:nucleosome binding factor SPN SPT16 subunit